eukprot:5217988-Alexandrium_andersonii.AAC.1
MSAPCDSRLREGWPRPNLANEVVQYIIEQMEGWQLRFSTLVSASKPKKRNEEWDVKADGYKYIRDNGPRANNMNQFMEFADKESHEP